MDSRVSRACRNDFGPEQFASTYAITQREDEIEVRTHVACTNDAVGHKQVQRLESEHLIMRMHIPKARNQELAGTVYAYCVPWSRDPPAHLCDPAISNEHRHGRYSCAANHINDCRVCNNDRRRS